ncbi:hypothetical protein AT6N2_C1836 [Agrobacterium tumefaciens]|nr:hypothetical protein AT6N2_C1836 [Agrobacterium tumefaciens]
MANHPAGKTLRLEAASGSWRSVGGGISKRLETRDGAVARGPGEMGCRIFQQAGIESIADIRPHKPDIGKKTVIKVRETIRHDTVVDALGDGFNAGNTEHSGATPNVSRPCGYEFQFHSPFCRAHDTYPFVTARCGTAPDAPRARSCLELGG